MLGLVVSVALGGCASVPDDSARVQARPAAGLDWPADLRPALHDAWPAEDWWRAYGDAQLDALVDAALRDNPGLEVAGARVSSAQAALAVTRAGAGLVVDLNAGAVRTLYSSNGLFPPPIGGNAFTDLNAQVNVRQEIDLWGRTHALIASALDERAAREADHAQVRQAVAVGVAQAYFEWQADQAVLADLREQLALQQSLVDDRLRRQSQGLASADEARLEQARAAALQARIAEAEGHALAEREALRALAPVPVAAGTTATNAAAASPAPATAHGSTLPASPVDTLHVADWPASHATAPGSLGFELLARRPDLQAARLRVESAMGRADAARAAFYPQINLGLAAGLDSISLEHLFEAGSETYALGPTLSLPIFNGARLRGQLDAARSARDEAIAAYNQQVVDAARDVAQNAAQWRALSRQLALQEEATARDLAVQASAEARLRQGLAARADVWHARLVVHQDQQAQWQLRRALRTADLALTRALGGGYRAPTAAAAAASARETH